MPSPSTRSLVSLAALAAGLALTATAAAQEGGAPPQPTGGSPPQTTGGAPLQSTGGSPAPQAGEIALAVTPDALVRKTVTFTGSMPGASGGGVVVERFDDAGARWVPVARAPVRADGTFAAAWRPEHIGRFRFRATADRGDGAAAASASREVGLTVYRPALATWFGPGFFGKRTACGQRMSRRLLGVAHRRLPCGTQVALHYRGRSITVPVVDRGPFRADTDWDLTAATAQALDFTVTDRIGALRLRDRVAPAAPGGGVAAR